jgi:hypothetical protein
VKKNPSLEISPPIIIPLDYLQSVCDLLSVFYGNERGGGLSSSNNTKKSRKNFYFLFYGHIGLNKSQSTLFKKNTTHLNPMPMRTNVDTKMCASLKGNF